MAALKICSLCLALLVAENLVISVHGRMLRAAPQEPSTLNLIGTYEITHISCLPSTTTPASTNVASAAVSEPAPADVNSLGLVDEPYDTYDAYEEEAMVQEASDSPSTKTAAAANLRDDEVYYLRVVDATGVETQKRLFFVGSAAPSSEAAQGKLLSVQARPAQVSGAAFTPCRDNNRVPPEEDHSPGASLETAAAVLVDSWELTDPQGAQLYNYDSYDSDDETVSIAAVPSPIWPPALPYDVASVTFLLNLCGTSNNATLSSVRSLWFDDYAAPGATTLQSYFNNCSYNGFRLNSGNSIVIGPINVPCSGFRANNITRFSTSTCSDNDFYGWAEYAENYTTQVLKINISSYIYRMHLFNNPACGFTGMGNSGMSGPFSRVWSNTQGGQPALSSIFHELGHTFYLNHAQGIDGGEYTDPTCAMGYCCGIRCYNTPHSVQLGWSRPVSGGTLSSSNLVTGTWKIITVDTQIWNAQNHIQVRPSTWTGRTAPVYYIGYRTRSGYDNALSNFDARRVNVYSYNATSSYELVKTRLHAALAALSIYDDASSKLRIKAYSTGASTAKIGVCRWASAATECS